MMSKTTTFAPSQPMLFLGECCATTFTERADWTAHHKKVHPSGKGIIGDQWKMKPEIFCPGSTLAPKPNAKLRPVTLSPREKEWLGKEIRLACDDVWNSRTGAYERTVRRGYVWSFGYGDSVAITVFDETKGHNVIHCGSLASATLV